MRIAVLCCGPSLPDAWADWKRPAYDLVIAINGAILKYPCDWAACSDHRMSMEVIKAIRAGRLPRVRCLMSCYVKFAKRLGLELHHPPLRRERIKYTTPSAVALACLRFKGELVFEFFGYDASSAKDFDGRHGNHSRNRWVFEVAAVREAIAKRGAEAKGLPSHV
jgi:hypothetical protein